METVIIINPDRFSRQSFPPFLFLCRALLEKKYRVRCFGVKKHSSLPKSEDFHFFSPFSTVTVKPILYGVRFVLFSYFKVIQLILADKCNAVLVFRSCDSLTHFLTTRLLGVKLVFLVDHLPWKKNESLFANPKIVLQVLGLCLSDKLILSSNYNAKELVNRLPFLKKKILIESYSPEIYQSVETSIKLKSSLHARFGIESALFILSGQSAAEISIRALAKFKNLILLLQIDEADSDYFIGLAQALGFINRIELITPETDLLEFIPVMDLLIAPSSGGYALTALSQGIPVLMPDTEEMREWVSNEQLIYKPSSVQSLTETLSKILGDKKLRKSAMEKSKVLQASESWGIRVIKQIGL